MPALAGGRGRAYNSETSTSHPEVDDVWIQEEATTRDRRSMPEDFIMDFLRLKGLSAVEAAKVKEVVIVTHGKQLQNLLGKGKCITSPIQPALIGFYNYSLPCI